jgi:hypothetical protein
MAGAVSQSPTDTTATDSTAAATPDTAAVATPPPAPAPAVTTTPPPAPPPAAVTTAPPPAQRSNEAGMFSKGRRRVSVVGGWGHTFGQDYLLIGIGVGYFIKNGLDVGVDFEGWVLNDPKLYKLSPRIDYVLWKSPRIKPYGGAFYRYSFISGGLDDLGSVGGRAGVFYKGTKGGMAGAGMVYERYLNCDDTIYSSCEVTYPEIFFAVSF